jgi:predicted nucleotidyltransferase
MKLEEIKGLVLPACRKYNVKRLDVFGSVARGGEKEPHDVDFLVEFDRPDHLPSKRFFGLLHYLEDTLGRPIDLVSISGIRNPFFHNRVMQERKNVYEG